MDYGSGAGAFLITINRWFPNCDLTGLDVEEDLLDFTRQRLPTANLRLVLGETWPVGNKTIDVVSCIQVIEHLRASETFFSEANRVLRDRGILILSTPNPLGWAAQLLKEKWMGFDETHISLKTPKEWRKLIDGAGFEILEDGTTGLSGFRILRTFPFGLLNWVAILIFGYFPWYKGESYVVIARKKTVTTRL